MNKQTQALIEQLLDWRSPYGVDTDIVDYITAQAATLRKKTKNNPSFADRYAQNCGELPTTMLDKVDDAKALLTRWRDARAHGTLDQQTLTRKDLSVTSDCLQFIMLPFTRFSSAASDTLKSGWGAVAASFVGKDSQYNENLTNKAEEMTQEQKSLCRLLLQICQSTGYKTGVKLPQGFDVDNSWRR